MDERLEKLRNAIQEQVYGTVFIRIDTDKQCVFVRISCSYISFELEFSFNVIMTFPYQVLAEEILRTYERNILKRHFKYRW